MNQLNYRNNYNVTQFLKMQQSTLQLFHYLISCCTLLCFYTDAISVETYVQERVVTDLDILQGSSGTSLDFRYNETSRHDSSQLTSAPGCPKSIDGYPWIYHFHRISQHRVELRCHLAGTQGPCAMGQALFLQSGTTYGVCGCDCLLDPLFEGTTSNNGESKERHQMYQLCYSRNIPQGQVYDPLDKTVCYKIGDKGPCSEGTVLAVPVTTDWELSETVTCLPICDFDDRDWISKHRSGSCTVSPREFGFGGGSSANVLANDCPTEERYSAVLKKCLKRHPKKNLILG